SRIFVLQGHRRLNSSVVQGTIADPTFPPIALVLLPEAAPMPGRAVLCPSIPRTGSTGYTPRGPYSGIALRRQELNFADANHGLDLELAEGPRHDLSDNQSPVHAETG